jgi:hypothetical protein
MPLSAASEPVPEGNPNITGTPGRSGRELRALVRDALGNDDWEARLGSLGDVPPERLIGAFFAALNDAAPVVRWHAVTAFGQNTASIAERDAEKARVVIRRCVWNLNDESGGIGWGIPEAMGESLARSAVLAAGFHSILISYVFEDGEADNLLEFAPLRKGAWWGIARLAEARPELVSPSLPRLLDAAFREDDPDITALACLLFGRLGAAAASSFIRGRIGSAHRFELYRNERLETVETAALALEALERCSRP